jgi:pyruvate dehydrogenase E2 component (dihydrolipoamide acetyltransferase)
MPSEVTMPQLSDTMTEGTVVKWHKQEGEKVRAGEEIADVETDKAVMPMEAFDGGTLAVIKAKEGDKVAVGGLLAVIATAGEKLEDIKQKYAAGGGAGAGAPSKAAPKPAATAPESKPASRRDCSRVEASIRAQARVPRAVRHGKGHQFPRQIRL